MKLSPRRCTNGVVLVLLLLVLTERPAHAYVDPGSASYVFQLLLGGVLAATYAAHAYWARLKDFVRTHLVRPRHADR